MVALLVMDDELKNLILEETEVYQNEIGRLESKLIDLIVPRDKNDTNNAILEVRAATGGREAAIFASDIFSMYQKFSSNMKWKFDVLTESDSTEGGLKEASASVIGSNVFGLLKVGKRFRVVIIRHAVRYVH